MEQQRSGNLSSQVLNLLNANAGSSHDQCELEKEIEDVKLLVESIQYQKDDPSQQQQALRALGEILSQNSESIKLACCRFELIWKVEIY